MSRPLPGIPFNKPYMTGRELRYIAEAHACGVLAGEGEFTRRCQSWLEKNLLVKKAILTHSCTAALEMSAILAGIRPGDEVIMPSYAFVSAANAFVLRGGVPVFVDIRPDTLNIDENLIEAAITKRTKAIVPVHYGGVACEMDTIMAVARKHGLLVIEDAAHGVTASYKGRPLGSIGHMGCLSFHETKVLISGQGGALLINDERFISRAEILRDRGTDRHRFLKGQIDRYSWRDIGSCYAPGEVTAAFLWGQMEEAGDMIDRRLCIWNAYHEGLEQMETERHLLRRPVIPEGCRHNAHLYYILLRSPAERPRMIDGMRRRGVDTAFHYTPLHSSAAGLRFAKACGELAHTRELSGRLLRLPLWIGLDAEQVIQTLTNVLEPEAQRIP